jgi:putative cell wall-binding protein
MRGFSGVAATAQLVAALFVVLLGSATVPSDAHALYLNPNTIPGRPLCVGTIDELTAAQPDSVHRMFLLEGQDVTFDLGSTVAGTDYDLHLYPPGADDFGTLRVHWSVTVGSSDERIEYPVLETGWYYLRVRRAAGSGDGSYYLYAGAEWPTAHTTVDIERLWGSDRYTTAVRIAAENFPEWRNVNHVIIASGEDRAAADPLSAAGLSYAYGAPIFLVQSDSVSPQVLEALRVIERENGPFHVHIVGGPVSVGPEVLTQISVVPNVTFDRLEPNANRYELAATIARRMEVERPLETFMRPWVGANAALIANGEDPDKFFDALALSPMCVTTGWPILLVGEDHIPAETQAVLDDLDLRFRVIGGGPATVSESVKVQLEAGDALCNRVWGDDRYETAVAIMEEALDGMPPTLNAANTGVVAKMPDALTGGSALGLRQGCLVLTQTDRLPSVSRRFLGDHTWEIDQCWALGGPASIDGDTMGDIDDALEH